MTHALMPLLAALCLMNIAAIAPTTLDRLMAYFRMLVRAEMPKLTFLGCYEYAVQAVESLQLADGTIASYSITPTDSSLPLPGSKGIPLRLPCKTATLAVGQLVLIIFVNGDQSRPAIISSAPTPTNMVIDASALLKLGPSAAAIAIAGGGPAIGRVGDAVSVTFSVADFTPLAAGLLCAGSGSPPTVSGTAAPFNITGTITAGSPKVQSG